VSSKSSIVTPVPKANPPSNIESDLRPILLTCTLAKVIEGFTCKRLLSQLDGKMDPRQYSRKGHSTTDALLYMLQAIYEAVDAAAHTLFADFSKGFDLIDHNILMQELIQLQVSPVIVSWIAGFLSQRMQAVRIGNTLSDWKEVKGGIPQETKLGVILFSVMTNRLLADWKLRIKYVDDTSAVEIIPRNSLSYLNTAVLDIQNFANEHKMKLNPVKCKEMLINVMCNPNITISPINIGSRITEQVTSFKLLGVMVDNRLKWDNHVDYIFKKASKRLYSLRLLKRAGVERQSIVRVYKATVRPILEYAVPVWQVIPNVLSDKIESIQRRALHTIAPEFNSYTEALDAMKLETLAERRHNICVQYMTKIKTDKNHPLHILLPKEQHKNNKYNLRSKQNFTYLFKNVQNCNTIRTENFFMLKYFNS